MNNLERARQALELYQEYPEPQQLTILALIKKGLDINETYDSGWTLLHRAAESGHLDVCEELVAQDADINSKQFFGTIPLHWAAKNGHLDVCDLLIQRGAELHARNNDGLTPLHEAAYSSSSIQTLLLFYGANVWAQNTDGETALNIDITNLIQTYKEKWQPILAEVLGGKCDVINSTQDLYHLASMMQPENPKNIPPPKEFIRILFQQYLPHELKFNAMYAEIFSHSRPPQHDLQSARKAAQCKQVVL